jgi:hypothetical protein
VETATWSSPSSRGPWLAGLIVAAVSVGLFLFWGLVGFPGEVNGCVAAGNCYCEAPVSGPVATLGKQPANTWSNLFPILAGLAILVMAGRDRGRAGLSANPMTGGGLCPVLFGLVVLLLGPGSMAFHGSLTRFGGWLDTLSMIAFISLLLVYDAVRLLRFDGNRSGFLVAYGAILGLLGALTWVIDGSGTPVFAVLVAIAVLLEAWICLRSPMGISRTAVPWLLAAVGTFGLALVVWRLSWTGAPLCDPTSLIQGHAVWHGLAAAVAPLCIFGYLRTERASQAVTT